MMDRRRFLVNSTGTIAGSLLIPRLAEAATQESLPAGAVSSGILDALPGKRPLIKRSFRPQNYETPVAMFREAFTPNDAFYARWHSAVPEVSLADWRLRIAGPGVQSPREFTQAELTRKFKVHEVAAVNQCSATGAACSCRTCPACSGATARWAMRCGAACA